MLHPRKSQCQRFISRIFQNAECNLTRHGIICSHHQFHAMYGINSIHRIQYFHGVRETVCLLYFFLILPNPRRTCNPSFRWDNVFAPSGLPILFYSASGANIPLSYGFPLTREALKSIISSNEVLKTTYSVLVYSDGRPGFTFYTRKDSCLWLPSFLPPRPALT